MPATGPAAGGLMTEPCRHMAGAATCRRRSWMRCPAPAGSAAAIGTARSCGLQVESLLQQVTSLILPAAGISASCTAARCRLCCAGIGSCNEHPPDGHRRCVSRVHLHVRWHLITALPVCRRQPATPAPAEPDSQAARLCVEATYSRLQCCLQLAGHLIERLVETSQCKATYFYYS
jgi:hypothetical protein